jgi:hypothetical protein
VKQLVSRRAALSFSALAVAVLAMRIRGAIPGPRGGGGHALLAATTALVALAGLLAAVGFSVANKLRGKGEWIALISSLLVTTIAFAYAALMIYAFDAAAHS